MLTGSMDGAHYAFGLSPLPVRTILAASQNYPRCQSELFPLLVSTIPAASQYYPRC